MQILDFISENSLFIAEIKLKFPTIDFITPIISVMTKHLYTTSSVLNVINLIAKISDNYEENCIENTEKEILGLGIKLLERLVDINELKKQIKLFKDSSASFNPNVNSNGVTQLENSLLFFICILQVKIYFPLCQAEVLDSLKSLIKKEISYIEGFKRDVNNEKNPKYMEIIDICSKRIFIEIAILKILNKASAEKFVETSKDIDACVPYANGLRDINNLMNETFDKYLFYISYSFIYSKIEKKMFIYDNHYLFMNI